MDLHLYNKIKAYKAKGELLDISKFSKLRFQRHYNSDWIVISDKLYFQNKLVVKKSDVQWYLFFL
jgi:hypothetical protein